MKKETTRKFGQIVKESAKIKPKLLLILLAGTLVITLLIWTLLMAKIPSIDISIRRSITIDGGTNGADGALGMVIDESGFLYATGYVTIAGEGTNIWLAKFDSDLIMLKNSTINGPANGDDMGYVLVRDKSDFLYLIGYISEIGENHNIFLAKFNHTDLSMIKNITINGLGNGIDEGYGMLFNVNDNYLYITGTVEEPDEGYNIYIAKFDTDLNQIKNITLNGPINGTDKGRFLTVDDNGNLYVSGSKSQVGTGYDFWLGKFDINLTFLGEIIVSSLTNGEDKGYGLVYGGEDSIYITGTLNHDIQGLNIFLAKYDTSLNQIKNITLNGPANGEDVSYSIFFDGHYLGQTGVYTEIDGGANIWIALYNEDLKLLAHKTIDGDSHDYDTGYGIINEFEYTYISGFVTEPSESTNIWIAKYYMGPVRI